MIKQTTFQESSLGKNFISDTCVSAAIHMSMVLVNFRVNFRKNKLTAKHQNV